MSAGSTTADDWDADGYARHAHFVPELARELVDWLAPETGERILDLGCGDGVLSRVIAERGAQVVGFDRSPAFVSAMRANGFEAVQGDGQALTYDGEFDAVFSNAALHWMSDDPQAVMDGIARALRPGGRFVAEFGAQGNVAPVHDALMAEAQARGRDAQALDPWFFPRPENYIEQLESAGFEISRQQVFERPTPLPGDMADWLVTLSGPFVQAFDPGAERDAFVAAVRARLEPELCNGRGEWTVPYVRLRFDAHKPA